MQTLRACNLWIISERYVSMTCRLTIRRLVHLVAVNVVATSSGSFATGNRSRRKCSLCTNRHLMHSRRPPCWLRSLHRAALSICSLQTQLCSGVSSHESQRRRHKQQVTQPDQVQQLRAAAPRVDSSKSSLDAIEYLPHGLITSFRALYTSSWVRYAYLHRVASSRRVAPSFGCDATPRTATGLVQTWP